MVDRPYIVREITEADRQKNAADIERAEERSDADEVQWIE